MSKWLYLILFAVCGAAMMVVAAQNYLKFRKIDRYGKVAVVIPFQQYAETTRTTTKLGIPVNESKTYTATISVRTEDNQVFSLENRIIPDKEMNLFRQGMPVSIKYLPSDPYEMNKFPSEDSGALWLFGFGAGLLLIAYVMAKRRTEEQELDEVRI